MRTTLVALLVALGCTAQAVPVRAADEPSAAPNPWAGQIGAGADLVPPVIAPTVRAAFTHKRIPFWFDFRGAWGIGAGFALVEVGVENRFLPAAQFTPVWTARVGLVLVPGESRSIRTFLATSGFGFAFRLGSRFSAQFASEFSIRPGTFVPIPRFHVLANFHF